MRRKHPHLAVSRRKFLAGVAVASGATAVPPAKAATSASTNAPARMPSALPPTAHVAAAETGTPSELSTSRIGGTDLGAAHRPPGVPTFHSAQDINALVRDFTKWDDTPVSLQHFAQSFVRAFKIAMTPPCGPVAISLDAGLQQEPIRNNGERLS